LKKQPLTRSASMPQPSKPKLRTNSDTTSSPVPRPQSRTPPVQAKNKGQQTTQSTPQERPGPGYKRNLRDLVKHKREQYAEGRLNTFTLNVVQTTLSSSQPIIFHM
jgi:hypothetical protein